MKNNSAPGTLNAYDWKKLETSFLLAIAGAVALWFADQLSIIDFEALGKWGTIVGPLAPFVVNFLRKWAAGK